MHRPNIIGNEKKTLNHRYVQMWTVEPLQVWQQHWYRYACRCASSCQTSGGTPCSRTCSETVVRPSVLAGACSESTSAGKPCRSADTCTVWRYCAASGAELGSSRDQTSCGRWRTGTDAGRPHEHAESEPVTLHTVPATILGISYVSSFPKFIPKFFLSQQVRIS